MFTCGFTWPEVWHSQDDKCRIRVRESQQSTTLKASSEPQLKSALLPHHRMLQVTGQWKRASGGAWKLLSGQPIMLLLPLPPSGCVQKGKQVMGNHPHPSWHRHLEAITISQVWSIWYKQLRAVVSIKLSDYHYPHPRGEMATSQGARWGHALGEARPEFLGLPARAKTPMPYFDHKQTFNGSASLDNEHCITDRCGHRWRLLLGNLMDYIRTSGFGTTLEDGKVRKSRGNGGGLISCLSCGKGSWNTFHFI